MKKVFSNKYIDQQNSIEEVLISFNDSGSMIGSGNRNVIKTFEIEKRTINIKSFKTPHLFNKIVYRFFRESKAKRSFDYAQKLLSLNILTPFPVAYFEELKGLFLLRSFYISEQLEYDLIFRDLILKPDYPNREKILRAFTRFTYELHEKGVLFKDHSPGNTLIKINNENYHFYLVDLNRMKFNKLDFESRIKNFRRLTPKKEMVAIMSAEYALLTGKDEKLIFEKMWHYTSAFQKKYHKKIALKKKIYFWKKKYKKR